MKSGPFCIVMFFFQKAINVHTLQDLTDSPRKFLKMGGGGGGGSNNYLFFKR